MKELHVAGGGCGLAHDDCDSAEEVMSFAIPEARAKQMSARKPQNCIVCGEHILVLGPSGDHPGAAMVAQEDR